MGKEINNCVISHQDDEIDLVELLMVLWESRRKIFFITSLFFILGVGFSLVTPKEYKASASFFVTSNNQAGATLSGYASLLGVAAPSDIEGLIVSVLDSRSIKEKIASQYIDQYESEIQEQFPRYSQSGTSREAIILDIVISELNLKNKFSHKVNKNGLFTLSFISKNKNFCVSVLNEYLKNIVEYNENLEISAEKNIIKIIDTPQTPIKKFKPKRVLIVLIGFSLGGFISIIFVFIQSFLKQTFKETNK